jgi:regulator of protease activity HflC (stomatin/prohibitin superfamily)
MNAPAPGEPWHLSMQTFLTFLSQNKEWLFSGIGVTTLTCVFLLFRHVFLSTDSKSANNKPEQRSAPSSTHIDRPNRLNFADGTIGVVEAGFTCHIVDPVLYTYEADKPIDIVISIADSRCRQTLESRSISEVRTRRHELERMLVNSLQPDFKRYGLQIDSFYIGSIRDVARPAQLL